MKRELADAVGPQSHSQLATAASVDETRDSQNLTRSTTQSSSCVDDIGCKRFKGAKVNGFIVYSRVRKSSNGNGEPDKISEDEKIKRIRSSEGNAMNNFFDVDRNCKEAETLTEENQVVETGSIGNNIIGNQAVENVTGEQSHCNGEMVVCKDEPMNEPEPSLAKEFGAELALALIGEGSGRKGRGSGRKENKQRRFTRSTFKVEVEPVEVTVNGIEAIDSETLSTVKVETIAEGSALTPPKKNLELKMSKKIALENMPMTVKELFETGLLEGVPVVYMGGKKFQAFGLRGTIKDVGILCSCSLCKGCRVIPPSQFEIHAIKQYRRAAQYICFENGKSLLDVLNVCRSSPLDSLEATIQNAISGLPVEKTFTCKRCKGIFPTACVGKVGPLCNSCAEPKESHGSSTCETSVQARHNSFDFASSCCPYGEPEDATYISARDVYCSVEPVLSLEHPASASVSASSQENTKQKTIRKSSKSILRARDSKDSPVRKSSRKKTQLPLTPVSSKPDLVTKPSKSVSVSVSSQKTKQWKTATPRKSKSFSMSKPIKRASTSASSQHKYPWKITKKDQRLHKLVFEEGGLPDGTEVAYYARGQKLLLGYKRGFGILCCCCNCEVSPSTFEAHAGWATRKKPYAYIYTSNGVSLHELAISLSKDRRYSAKDNDDLCIICADGGNLVLCDGCPRAFHKDCASLSSIPRGDWYCQFCENMFQREKFVEHNVNAIAAGRVSGVDPIEQINKRCMRIVKNIEAELTGCALCRGYDFSRSGFGPRTIIICDQCEKEFHIGCLRSHKIANLKELPKGKWFCCPDCSRIHSTLQKLLVRGAEKLPESLLNVIKKKQEEKGLEIVNDIDVRWRLLNGKIATPETKLLLSQALAIFQECFDPIIDSPSGRDLIPLMVYGKNSKGQDYGGMYCAVLTVNSFVVSAGIIRIFGQEVAELPLVATSTNNHGKGYFQLLFSCIEKLLAFLNVQSIMLPAAEEAEAIWTEKFGFQKMKPDQLSRYRKSCCQMVTFKGTCMLQKPVPACRIVNQNQSIESVENC